MSLPLSIKDCRIIGTFKTENIITYVIFVEPHNGNSWYTQKRYSQFLSFHQSLLDCIAETSLPPGAAIPSKSFWGLLQSEAQQIEQRCLILQNYLRKLLQQPSIASSPILNTYIRSDSVVQPNYTPHLDTTQELKQYNFSSNSEVTDVRIPLARIMNDYILYQIDITNSFKHKSYQRWTTLKRFSSFVELDQNLRKEFSIQQSVLSQFPFPPEKYPKVLYDHMDVHFVEYRRVLLEYYLQRLLLLPGVQASPTFLGFLGI